MQRFSICILYLRQSTYLAIPQFCKKDLPISCMGSKFNDCPPWSYLCMANEAHSWKFERSASSSSVLARPFWSGEHHLVCLVHHFVSSRKPFAPLGWNSNYDIHSTTQTYQHLTQAIQCIYKDHLGQFTPLHHLVCNFQQEHCPIGRIASFLYFAEDYYKVGLGNAAMLTSYTTLTWACCSFECVCHHFYFKGLWLRCALLSTPHDGGLKGIVELL